MPHPAMNSPNTCIGIRAKWGKIQAEFDQKFGQWCEQNRVEISVQSSLCRIIIRSNPSTSILDLLSEFLSTRSLYKKSARFFFFFWLSLKLLFVFYLFMCVLYYWLLFFFLSSLFLLSFFLLFVLSFPSSLFLCFFLSFFLFVFLPFYLYVFILFCLVRHNHHNEVLSRPFPYQDTDSPVVGRKHRSDPRAWARAESIQGPWWGTALSLRPGRKSAIFQAGSSSPVQSSGLVSL